MTQEQRILHHETRETATERTSPGVEVQRPSPTTEPEQPEGPKRSEGAGPATPEPEDNYARRRLRWYYGEPWK